jgi:hypothetical protein
MSDRPDGGILLGHSLGAHFVVATLLDRRRGRPRGPARVAVAVGGAESPFTSYAGATHGSVLPTAAHDLLRGALT